MILTPAVTQRQNVAQSRRGRLVWLPNWRDQVDRQGRALNDATVADAALLCREPRAIARNIVFPAGCLPDMEQGCGKARSLIGIAPAVALVDAGPLAPREVVGVYSTQNHENGNASIGGSGRRSANSKAIAHCGA